MSSKAPVCSAGFGVQTTVQRVLEVLMERESVRELVPAAAEPVEFVQVKLSGALMRRTLSAAACTACQSVPYCTA